MKPSVLALAIGLVGLPLAASIAAESELGPASITLRGAPEFVPAGFPLKVLPQPRVGAAMAPEELAAQSAAGATIPTWTASILGGDNQSYTFTMVGKNPLVHQANAVAAIKVPIVPIIFKFVTSHGTIVFDPTKADACSPHGSALKLSLQSPIFKKVTLSGLAKVGNGQFPDLFQRANLFLYTKPTGANPGLHLVLEPVVEHPFTVTVRGGTLFQTHCGFIGALDFGAWDSFIQGTLFNKLRAILKPTQFPLFLSYDVVLFQGTASNCCVLGFHNSFANPHHGGAFQTYSFSGYDSSGGFFNGVKADVSLLSHEISEWEDDPNGVNPTPPWGHIGQVAGCQNNLEVGDPLTPHLKRIKMPNGFTYHVQDLAFISWFYQEASSFGVNGWFSLFGTFRSSAVPCS